MDGLPPRSYEALPAGTVTFLYTDIESSTALASRYPAQMPALLQRHHDILQQTIQKHHGYVFRTMGDAFCAAFQTATDALYAALEAQQMLQHEAWEPAPIAVRMGIHTGAAQPDERGDHFSDYSGYLTLALVQRTMSSAYGGQVLLSNVSAELVRGQMPAGTALKDMGQHRLKGITDPVHLWQLVAPDLRSEFPALKTQSILPNNLPVQTTSFVGREHELAKVEELLAATHLLTLIGPGGTGKTRLSLELASEVLAELADGVWVVELAPLSNPALVLQTFAANLGVREIPGTTLLDQLTDYLSTREILIVLDNCEHLIETCAALVNHLIGHCPTLKIVASSREALGIAGETVFRVPPLNLPETERATLETIGSSEAVQLFVERAKAINTGFSLSAENADAVASICVRLDGIPLALELAAARISLLSPQQIAARLNDRFQLLTGGSRTALPRQQTLRSLIDWSYDLLSDAERDLLCQLSVFVGGWSLEAAEAVCLEPQVLELLGQLVKKSLVAADNRQGQAETRFHLLETIRQYARDRLLESGTGTQVRDRHLGYYRGFAEAGEVNFFSSLRLEWLRQCELEHDNFRAALQWGLDHDVESSLWLSGALATFWGTRGFNVEGRRWLQDALDRDAQQPELDGQARQKRLAARAKALIGFCSMYYGLGEYQAALDASKEAVRIYRQLGQRFELGMGLGYVGNMAAFQGDVELARQALSEAIHIGHELGSAVILSFALGVFSHYVSLPAGDIETARAYAEESMRNAEEIGMVWAKAQGDVVFARISMIQDRWDEARLHAQKAGAVFQDLGDPGDLIMVYNELAAIEIHDGNLVQARSYLQESLLTGKDLNLRAFVAQALESCAFIAMEQNEPARTARILGAADAMREGLGTSAVAIHRMTGEYESALAWLHGLLDQTSFEHHWSEGQALSMDQAIAYALEG